MHGQPVMDGIEVVGLAARLEIAIQYIRRLLHPEDLGHAVTQEVRDEAKRTLERVNG